MSTCAIIGCGSRTLSIGYCSKHYRKLRRMDIAGRLPSDWTAYAPANSVPDVLLPRGTAETPSTTAIRDWIFRGLAEKVAP